MQFLYLLAQEDPHGGGHAGSHPVSINPMDFADPANMWAGIWALVIFSVLALLLGKFAWGPIVSGLKSREDKINASLARAEEVEKATRELQETLAKERAKAQQEAQQIVADARVAAKHAAEEVTAKALAEIEAAKERHHRELSLEGDKVRAELRRDAVELTIAATAKLIGRSLDAKDQARLAEDALRDAESVARN